MYGQLSEAEKAYYAQQANAPGCNAQAQLQGADVSQRHHLVGRLNEMEARCADVLSRLHTVSNCLVGPVPVSGEQGKEKVMTVEGITDRIAASQQEISHVLARIEAMIFGN